MGKDERTAPAARGTIERLGAWVSGLAVAAVPARVMRKARLQLLSVLAASWAGERTRAGQTVLSVLRRRAGAGGAAGGAGGGGGGASSILPITGESMRLEDAVLAGAALGMTLDYDDYLWLGHTGHSAVWVSLLAAARGGRTFGEALAAQVAANEIAGRLGGFVVIGPQNGQLWSHIHLGAAAAAAARLRDLDAARTADALAIALWQPPFALWPGFMGSEAKVLTAALPSWQGLLAADLAAAGMRGARDVLDHPRGLGRFFAWRPAPHALTGLGAAWVTDTLAFKIYPGCAYVDAAVDAALEVLRKHEERTGLPLDPARVKAVRIRAGALTIGMERLSAPHRGRDPRAPLDPVEVNFSVRLSVAMALCRRGLRAADFSEEALAASSPTIRALAARTRLSHDLGMSRDLFAGLSGAVSLSRFAAGLAPRPLARLLGGAAYDLGRADLESLEFRFSAAVELDVEGAGAPLRAVQRVPRGAPGWDPEDTERLVQKKFLAEAAPSLGEARAAQALAAVLDDGWLGRDASDLVRLFLPSPHYGRTVGVS